MRNLFLGFILLLPACTQAQTPSPVTTSASVRASLSRALVGDWVGVLGMPRLFRTSNLDQACAAAYLAAYWRNGQFNAVALCL